MTKLKDKVSYKYGEVPDVDAVWTPLLIAATETCRKRQYNLSMAEEVGSQWRQSAPYWEKHRHIIRQMFAPITDALGRDAKIAPGYKVLDVGTGPGEPALTVAGSVGKFGIVHGIDPAPEMIAAARRASEREKIDNVHFEVSSADALPFAADTFDAIVSRFAVMFFPSPIKGIEQIFRVLKPNAYAAFAVWSSADSNPFHYLLSRVVERYVDSPPSPQDCLDAFRFAAPGKLQAILDQAGAVGTTERLLQFQIEAPVSVEDFWDLRSEMSSTLRPKLAMLSAETKRELRREVIKGLTEYSTENGVSFPAEVLVVSGSKRS